MAKTINHLGEIVDSDFLGSLVNMFGVAGARDHEGRLDPYTRGECRDIVHEEPGGTDRFGSRPQSGRAMYEKEVMTLLRKEHGSVAWDDVSGKELDADEVRRA